MTLTDAGGFRGPPIEEYEMSGGGLGGADRAQCH